MIFVIAFASICRTCLFKVSFRFLALSLMFSLPLASHTGMCFDGQAWHSILFIAANLKGFSGTP